MSKATKEHFIINSKGRRTGVILKIAQYQQLMQFKEAIDFNEIINEARAILNKEPVDANALAELIEDLEDIQYIFEHQDEAAIPWEKVKEELAHQVKL